MAETVYFSVLDPPASRASRRRLAAAPEQNGKCFYCKRAVYPLGSASALENPDLVSTRDHYSPQSLDGHIPATKIVIACQRCNSIKANTPPHVFECFVSKTDMRLQSTTTLRSKYRHFCYLLMIAGLKVATAMAKPTERAPAVPRDQRGRFTMKDLRRKNK